MTPKPPAEQPNLTQVVDGVPYVTMEPTNKNNNATTKTGSSNATTELKGNETLKNNTNDTSLTISKEAWSTSNTTKNATATKTATPTSNISKDAQNATKSIRANQQNNATLQLELVQRDYKALLERQKEEQQSFQWQLLQLEKTVQDARDEAQEAKNNLEQQMAAVQQEAQKNSIQAQTDFQEELQSAELHWITRLAEAQQEIDTLQTDLAQERIKLVETKQQLETTQRLLRESKELVDKTLQEKDKQVDQAQEWTKGLERQMVEKEMQLAQSQSMVRNLQEQIRDAQLENTTTNTNESPPQDKESVRKLLNQSWHLIKKRLAKRFSRLP
eukprot:scaffold13231_cov145-Amphora_coffeaeformis.AAC.1